MLVLSLKVSPPGLSALHVMAFSPQQTWKGHGDFPVFVGEVASTNLPQMCSYPGGTEFQIQGDCPFLITMLNSF